ncbi:MAG: hypothetical protein KatS3mg128_0959 [Silanimonas sp.]|nr:MAG: hypothetical protein KatS3mg127_0930 [Silanimonas sp.]GIX39910.1 MAG: hypothetical protein KatS3mg128_0959 [Silanimonas sp.]
MAGHPAAPKRNFAFPAIGALMLLAGLGFGGLRLAFLLGSETVEGEVVEIASLKPAGQSTRLGYPVVAFTTPAGERVRFTGSEGSSPAAYAVGERVAVRYRPEAPHEAQLASWGSLFGGHLLAIGLGLAFLWVGIKDLRTPPKA